VTTPSSKPAAKRTTGTATKRAAKPSAVTATEPAAKPVIEPASKPAAIAAAKPITHPVTVPAVTPALEISAPLTQKSQEQVVSSLQQGQQLLMDAAETWVNVFSPLPVMDLPRIPGLTDVPDMQAVTNFAFDIVGDLLSTQREFALELTKVLLPTKTV
jgi:hypothetical protein